MGAKFSLGVGKEGFWVWGEIWSLVFWGKGVCLRVAKTKIPSIEFRFLL